MGFLRLVGAVIGFSFAITASFFSILFLLLVVKAASTWVANENYEDPLVISTLVLLAAVLSGALGGGLLLWIFGS